MIKSKKMSVGKGGFHLSSKMEIVIEGLLGLDWSLHIKYCFKALSWHWLYMYLSLGQFHLLYPLKELYPVGKKEKSADTFSPSETGDHYC